MTAFNFLPIHTQIILALCIVWLALCVIFWSVRKAVDLWDYIACGRNERQEIRSNSVFARLFKKRDD